MRVSAAGWLYPTIERTREVARYTAEVTHNHLEGIKGAEATASCIFYARNGASKDFIKKYVEKAFGYDLERSLASIRPYYHHVESCQETVPEAIIAFLESDGFEDAIRNAVSLGGDTDTLAAITGSIAEAFYSVSATMRAECRDRIDADLLDILELFDNMKAVFMFDKNSQYGDIEDCFYDMLADFEKRLRYASENTDLPEKPDMNRVQEMVMTMNERVVRDEI